MEVNKYFRNNTKKKRSMIMLLLCTLISITNGLRLSSSIQLTDRSDSIQSDLIDIMPELAGAIAAPDET